MIEGITEIVVKHLDHQASSLIQKCIGAVEKGTVEESGLTRSDFEQAMEAASIAFSAEHPELTEAGAYARMLQSPLGKSLYSGSYQAYIAAHRDR